MPETCDLRARPVLARGQRAPDQGAAAGAADPGAAAGAAVCPACAGVPAGADASLAGGFDPRFGRFDRGFFGGAACCSSA